MEVFYIKQELPVNEQIRAKEVQVIDENGEKKGVMNINDALDLAFDVFSQRDRRYGGIKK